MKVYGMWSRFLLVLAVVSCLGTLAAAQLSGAIFTSTANGQTVNGNLYDAKTDVYLNGGPQNNNDPGLNDGNYYFQVTDPSGAVLLSADDISCRQVVVSGGRIIGVPSSAVPASCSASTPAGAYHPLGTFNNANQEQPVQLCPATSGRTDTLGAGPNFDANNWCDFTPNAGGEYKVWITPQANYSPDVSAKQCSSKNSNVSFGFCDSDSKTDNFKVKKATAAVVIVCKFNDLNGNGTQDTGEPLIPFWPITASGVDTLTGPIGTVNGQTDANGCVSFSVSTFPNSDNSDTVTLNETVLTGWQETGALDGTYDLTGNPANSGPTSVSGFVETINVKAGDTVTAPNFGNFCVSTSCGGQGLIVTKDANPSLTRTFTWGISKAVDNTQINTHGNGATFNYTVSVTHDAGTDSAWMVTGKIKVSNPNPVDIGGVNVSDAVDNGGNCTLTGGTNITVMANSYMDVPYTCTYSALPSPGTNTATATWDSSQAMGTASINFANAAIHAIDGMVTVTDTIAGTLGTVTYSDASPKTFMYSHTFTGDPAGTCTSHGNTATFTTDTTGSTDTASQTVKDCQGADLTVTKTAATAFNASITKSVDKTLVEQIGGTATFNYTVNVTTNNWVVSGMITVSNPNDWEDITANVSDALNDAGGVCVVTGGTGVSVTRSSFAVLPYTCAFANTPSSGSGINTAVATWDQNAFSTPDGAGMGSAAYAFGTLTITDTFNNATTTLGTITIPPGSATYTYARTVNVPTNNCVNYTNTATIVETGQNAQKTVEVCGPAKTGALTMGYWQNKNGQGIISGANQTTLGNYLRMYHPFSDAPSSGLAAYVSNIIKAATCTSTTKTCNSMLRAQMLATALDVFFSDASLGGNKIGAPAPIGGVKIDLTKICQMIDGSGTSSCSGSYENVSSAYGGATSLTVSAMLLYQNTSDPLMDAGAAWYSQNKAIQVLAKDSFDAINNQVVFAP